MLPPEVWAAGAGCSPEDFFNSLGSLRGTVKYYEVNYRGQKATLIVDYRRPPYAVYRTANRGIDNPPPPIKDVTQWWDWEQGFMRSRMYCPKDDYWYWCLFPAKLVVGGQEVPGEELPSETSPPSPPPTPPAGPPPGGWGGITLPKLGEKKWLLLAGALTLVGLALPIALWLKGRQS